MEILNLYNLLNAVKAAQVPVGANYLSGRMGIPPATIGRLMRKAEEDGYLVSISNKGRCITDKGNEYLDEIDTARAKQVAAKELIEYTAKPQTSTMKEILELRRLIEPYAAKNACIRMTDEELYELEELILNRDIEMRHGGLGAEPDLHFHLLIARCSGNRAIYHMLTLLLTENNSYSLFSIMTNKLNFNEMTRHNKIVSAFIQRDAEAAFSAMQEHLDKLLQCVESYNSN